MKLGATILCLVSALTTLVESVHVRGFTSYSCVGHQWVCYNLPAGTCCGPFPSPIYSMRWTLPADTRGIGHVNKYCTWPFPAVYGPRTNSCFNYLGQSVRSAKWQQGYCVWQWKRSVILERQDDKCAVTEGCAEPGVLVYITAEGAQRAVVVPAGTAGNVTAFLDAKDYKSLSTLADFKGELDLKTSVDSYNITAIAES